MIQRVCDACGKPVGDGVEHIEIVVESVGSYRGEHFHDECVNAGGLAERLRGLFDGDATRVKVERRKW